MNNYLYKHRQFTKEIIEVFETIKNFNLLMEIPYSEELGCGYDFDEYLYREFIGLNNKVKWILI